MVICVITILISIECNLLGKQLDVLQKYQRRSEEKVELRIPTRLEKVFLPDRKLNPGLPRDRRGYLPLYYRGLMIISVCSMINKQYLNGDKIPIIKRSEFN